MLCTTKPKIYISGGTIALVLGNMLVKKKSFNIKEEKKKILIYYLLGCAVDSNVCRHSIEDPYGVTYLGNRVYGDVGFQSAIYCRRIDYVGRSPIFLYKVRLIWFFLNLLK